MASNVISAGTPVIGGTPAQVIATPDVLPANFTAVATDSQGVPIQATAIPAGIVTGLASVAKTGAYSDLVSLPSIPSKTSDLVNDAGFITAAAVPATPTKVSQLTNDSGFITAAAVPAPVTKVSQLTNDSAFITSTALPTKVSQLSNDTGFITAANVPAAPTKVSQLTNDTGFITAASLPSVPTKVSQLTNDSAFITAAAVPTNVSQLTNDAGYAVAANLAASATTNTTYAPNITSGTLSAGRMPAFTGDVTSTVGTVGLTLAAFGTAGTFGVTSVTLGGNPSILGSITVDSKGRVSSVTAVALGSAATYNIGTSGANVPLLNAANIWSSNQTMNGIVANGNANYGVWGIGTAIQGPTITRSFADAYSALTVNLGNASSTGNVQQWQFSGSNVAIINKAGSLVAQGYSSFKGDIQPVNVQTAAYTLTANDYSVVANGTADLTFTTPAAPNDGQIYNIVNLSTGTVTLNFNGKTYLGSSTTTIAANARLKVQYSSALSVFIPG